MEQFLFWLYALLAGGGAVAVVLSQNVVRMAFYLVVSLGSTAALFFLLGADFVGATQLLIYVGGTVVLLIFGVMLTASAPFSSIENTPAEIIQGGVVGLAFLAVVIATVLQVQWPDVQAALAHHVPAATAVGFNRPEEGNSSRSIGTALLGARFDRDLAVAGNPAHEAPHGHSEAGHVHGHAAHSHDQHAVAESKTLSTGYLLPFEIVSVHLLVVLVGAGYLARAKRPQPSPGI